MLPPAANAAQALGTDPPSLATLARARASSQSPEHLAVSPLTAWIGAVTALSATVALAIAVTTPARSGNFCTDSCLSYPYTDAAAFVPRDYLWMYPATLMALSFLALTVCLLHDARPEHRALAGIGSAVAGVAVAALAVDYAIQLAVVAPSLVKGEMRDLSLWSMYNPHGVYVALEDLAFLLFGVAFFFLAWVFAGRGRLERALQRLLFLGAAIIMLLLAGLTVRYGVDLDYHFEVWAILIGWSVLIATGAMLVVLFRRQQRTGEGIAFVGGDQSPE